MPNAPDETQTTRFLLSQPSRPSLLLVEDDRFVSELLATFVRAEGFSVTEVASAEEALSRIREQFHSVVITDLQMPGAGGLELCRALRASPLEGYVYIIVLTGQRSDDTVVKALQAGADDYVRKDVSRTELAARLQTATRIVTLEQRLRWMLDEQRRLAASDALTNLPNRRAFAKHFNAEFKRALRFNEDLAVLLLDIDHFKRINDQYGHAVGDEVLRLTAQRVAAALPRSFDLFARLGGEEFAAMLPQTHLEGASVVAERIRQAVAETPFQIAGRDIDITISIGVSALSERHASGAATPDDLLDLADQRLYVSKRTGRNRVTSTTPHAGQPRGLSELYSA